MRKGLVENSGGHVGHAGDREYVDSHVAGGDDFCRRRHAHQIGADTAEVFDFRGSFVTRAQQRGVDAFMQNQSLLGGFFAGNLRGSRGSKPASCRESGRRSDRHSGRPADSSLQIDVIADQNQGALREPEIDASGGVGDDEGANPHAREYPDGKSDLLRGVSLIKMNAALHGSDRDGAGIADDQTSGVADRGGLRESGMSEYGMASAFVRESANAPRPEPRMRPTLGRRGVRARISCAAASAWVN